MKIQVTDEDIKGGIRGDCHHCPIARAVRRITGRGGVSVGFTIAVNDRLTGQPRYHKMPETALAAIKWFDNTGMMEPFEFEMV